MPVNGSISSPLAQSSSPDVASHAADAGVRSGRVGVPRVAGWARTLYIVGWHQGQYRMGRASLIGPLRANVVQN